MSARFEALDELFDDALELPIQGKTYKIPSPPGEDGLRIQRITTAAARIIKGGEAINTTLLDDEQELDLIRLCLGPVYDQLMADGVSWAWIKHAGLTAMLWVVSDVETAQRFWASAGRPEAVAPNRAARRRARRSGSAAAKSTRSRGSTSGTNAPRDTASGHGAATTSPGEHSSPNGH